MPTCNELKKIDSIMLTIEKLQASFSDLPELSASTNDEKIREIQTYYTDRPNIIDADNRFIYILNDYLPKSVSGMDRSQLDGVRGALSDLHAVIDRLREKLKSMLKTIDSRDIEHRLVAYLHDVHKHQARHISEALKQVTDELAEREKA